jgi:hypothetical protein
MADRLTVFLFDRGKVGRRSFDLFVWHIGLPNRAAATFPAR